MYLGICKKKMSVAGLQLGPVHNLRFSIADFVGGTHKKIFEMWQRDPIYELSFLSS